MVSSTGVSGEPHTRQSRTKAVIAGTVGNVLEWYDFAIYAFLVPIISKLFFAAQTPSVAILLTLAVFGSGFVARPLGAIVFGHLGDKYGRRNALSGVMLLMGAATFCMGLLPTYASAGIVAPILLVALRLVQGFASGGEWGGSASFVVEYAPANRRGAFGSLHITGVAAGFLIGAGIVSLLNTTLGAEAMLEWGWRVPLLLGVVVAGVGIIIRRNLEETPSFAKAQQSGETVQAPLRDTLVNNRGAVFTVLGITVYHAIASWVFLVYIVTYLSTVAKLPIGQALSINIWGLVVTLLVTPFVGLLSDRFGRKPFLLASLVLTIICVIPIFHLLNSGSYQSALLAHCAMTVILCLYFGPLPALLVELIPTKVRYSGLSIAYNMAHAVLGGFAPFIAQSLATYTGNPISTAYFVIAGALVSLFVLMRVKETAFSPLA